MEKWVIVSAVSILLFLVVGGIWMFQPFWKLFTCGDGTLYGTCSSRQPYFCGQGFLVENASFCGCPEILTLEENSCISDYQTKPRKTLLKYILRGKENYIDFTAYGGLVDYLLDLSPNVVFDEQGEVSFRDLKIRNINLVEQEYLILPLVTQIQNLVHDKTDQMRIAISLVQHIPYNESEKIVRVRNQNFNYSRYAYEVLYESQAACGGKSELLAFLLKEIGYGVVLFYYPVEDHIAVGVKCPLEYSLDNSGYCFIETTGPAIITNNQNYYIGWGKLSPNPEIISISEGYSLDDDLYEYDDADKRIKISAVIEEKGEINWFQSKELSKLKQKYGLEF